jgi:hypothetical protein
MKIKLGLLSSDPGWEILLEQEGVCFEIIDANSLVEHQAQYSLLIIHSNSVFGDPELISGYIKNGGTVLFEISSFTRVFKRKLYRKNIKHIYPSGDSQFSDLGVIDFFTDFSFVRDGQRDSLDNDLGIIWDEIGNGAIAVIPFEISTLLLNSERLRKRFPAEREELPSELVAKISKGKIRLLIRKILIKLFNFKGIPYIQKWFMNSTDESCFLFRIDTDFCSADDARKLYEVMQKYDASGTWFIDTDSEEMIRKVYKVMPDQEIAFHCDRHRIFRNYKKNRHLISKGIEKLHNNIVVNGYAAPFGEWNEELGEVLDDLRFEYSSEFSLNYDDLPYFPYWNGKYTNVLQIPIHPVSLGRLRRAHFSREEMVNYFKKVIDQRIEDQEPIIIYHHPSHQYFDVIEEIFSYIKTLDIQNFTFTQLAAWWKFRAGIQLETELHNSVLTLNSNGIFDFHLKLTWENEYTIIPYQNKINLSSLVKKKVSDKKDRVVSRKIRNFHWRDLLNDYESYKGKMRR